MQEYAVGKITEYPQGSGKVIKVAGREIGIFNIRGRLYGLPNTCPHQMGPLCASGKLTGTLIATKDTDWQRQWSYDGEVIQCPWHGLEFHVPTGQCLALRSVRLRRYDVVVDGEEVKVRF
ncbi:MAG: Rieske 2Fe-2S domain-containing protein [Ktedonobacteraceae bacterium]|nr:Rieske 2Fe-2S domain-containing protein [Ktedonobacteraceae bacterium]